MPELGWGGVLPFTWRSSTQTAFDAFRDDGKPVVVPIIQIIYSRAPDAARASKPCNPAIMFWHN